MIIIIMIIIITAVLSKGLMRGSVFAGESEGITGPHLRRIAKGSLRFWSSLWRVGGNGRMDYGD